jgi:hypothetical protein
MDSYVYIKARGTKLDTTLFAAYVFTDCSAYSSTLKMEAIKFDQKVTELPHNTTL